MEALGAGQETLLAAHTVHAIARRVQHRQCRAVGDVIKISLSALHLGQLRDLHQRQRSFGNARSEQ